MPFCTSALLSALLPSLRPRRLPCLLVLASSLLAVASMGCAGAAPYERGKLALPSMATSDLAGASEEHVRAVQEGATGGSIEVGGGCGCN
jgi:hypothetical protein